MQVELAEKRRQERACGTPQVPLTKRKMKALEMAKWVYTFGDGAAEGAADKRDLLGGKGANLAEMANLGLPVPPGFTISTEVCTYYYANKQTYPTELDGQVKDALAHVERITGRKFGDAKDPLLVSVRSGARASMPGMMDTVLNLGLNDVTVEALAKSSGDARFAYDSYRRFITMYSDVVLEVGHDHFEEILEGHKDRKGYTLDTDLTADDWADLITKYKARVKEEIGEDFPQDPGKQLWGAISAVFGSWMNARANTYRRLHAIPESWGTAVNVQAMVFGNMGDTSATGVAFTRNPSTGEKLLYGEFLINAQGEDVVAGIRTPQEITEQARAAAGSEKPSMEKAMPDAYAQLVKIYQSLEKHYRDMQDLEFTVEKGKLWMLQTRSGKRTAKAALRIAVELASEGLITRDEAVTRVDPAALDGEFHVLHVAIMAFQPLGDTPELGIGLRHGGFERRRMRAGGNARRLGQILRRADAGDHVLALRVDEEFAVKQLLARRGIARERNAGRRGVAHIAEHHGLDVDGGAPALRNAVQAAIRIGARIHPRTEHRADRA
ncbi:MAG: pyruvate, orthophosphate dikinase, partial [Hyphomicrobiales bacterium]